MKKTILFILMATLLVACKKGDSDFSAYTTDTGTVTTIQIV